jgi:hypothetical protein
MRVTCLQEAASTRSGFETRTSRKEFADWEAELEALYSGFAGSVGLALLALLLVRVAEGIGLIVEPDGADDVRRAEEIAMTNSAAANPKDQTGETAVNPTKKQEEV